MCEPKPKENIIELMGQEFTKDQLKYRREQYRKIQQAFLKKSIKKGN